MSEIRKVSENEGGFVGACARAGRDTSVATTYNTRYVNKQRIAGRSIRLSLM